MTGTPGTGKMQAGRQADSARRHQRVIAAINQAGTRAAHAIVFNNSF